MNPNSQTFQRIRQLAVTAMADFDMLEEGDRVLVAVSGGKDSSAMALVFEDIKRRAPFAFEFVAVLIDQKQPGFNASAFRTWIEAQGIPLTIIDEDTYSVVVEKTEAGKSYCGLCSRLRRGILYTQAQKMGCNKIALGHHRDDLNETVLLNLFFSGKIASMPPLLRADDGLNTVIRPFCYVPEKLLSQFSREERIPIIPCTLCGSQAGAKRRVVKNLLRDMEKHNPNVGSSMLAAQKNVRMSQLLVKG